MSLRHLWVSILALGVAGLMTTPEASAQGMIKLGAKGGVNIADFGGGDVDSLGTTETMTGFIGGGFVEIMIGDVFAIQPEVLYAQKGTKVSESGAEARFKVDYIEVPVLLKVNIPIQDSKVHPSVYAGPALAFEARCKLEGSFGGVTVSGNCEDQDVNTKSVDFGLTFGGGVSVDVGGADVGLDVRYTLGLQTIDDDPDPFDIKNKAISIMGTVGFSLPR